MGEKKDNVGEERPFICHPNPVELITCISPNVIFCSSVTYAETACLFIIGINDSFIQ